MEEIYLDQAATTRPYKEVIDAILPYLTEDYYNPSALYSNGAKTKKAIDDAKDVVAEFIGANSDEIYFTSGSSESNCTAILGFILNKAANFEMCSVITTKIEHKSIKSLVETYDGSPFCEFELLDVDEDGFVNENELVAAIEYMLMRMPPENILVSIQDANNEIGTIQNTHHIATIVHGYGCVFHVDATQSFGAIPTVVGSDIDMLSASAHKIHGPKGTGILYKRNGIDINPIIYGSQMNAMRGGTENVAGIVGMAKAVEIAENNIRNNSELYAKRNRFIDKLLSIGCKLNGSREHRLPNNISVQLPEGIGGEELLYMLDLSGIMIGTGSACNSRSKEPSFVLKAIGLSDDESARTIRITISNDISDEQIQYVVDEIEKAIKILGSEDTGI